MSTRQEDYEAGLNERIAIGDYQYVFTKGCCYHFALTLHRLYGFDLAYFKSSEGGVGHCWANRDSKVSIDVNGLMDQDMILKLFDRTGFKPVVLPITAEQLRESLNEKKFSEGMNAKLFALAEEIIQTHARFGDLKPFDPLVITEEELEAHRDKEKGSDG